MKIKVALLIDLSALVSRPSPSDNDKDKTMVDSKSPGPQPKADPDPERDPDRDLSFIIGSDVSHVEESNSNSHWDFMSSITIKREKGLENDPELDNDNNANNNTLTEVTGPDSSVCIYAPVPPPAPGPIDISQLQTYILERLTKDGTSASGSTTSRTFDTSNYQWSYKFYNSSSRPGNGQVFGFGKWGKKFLPFDHTEWEKFEGILKEQIKQAEENMEPDVGACGPGIDHLSSGLKNLISDLNWKDNDSGSGNDEQGSRSSSKNLIYALFRVPKTEDEIVEFAGSLKEVSNSKNFLAALLSKAFYRQCRETLGIRVNWVDLGYTHPAPDAGSAIDFDTSYSYPKPIPKVLHYLGSSGTGILKPEIRTRVKDHELPDWSWFLKANLKAASTKASGSSNRHSRLSDEGSNSIASKNTATTVPALNSRTTNNQDLSSSSRNNSGIKQHHQLQQRTIGSFNLNSTNASSVNRSRLNQSLNSTGVSHLSSSLNRNHSHTKSFLDTQNSRRPILVPSKSSGARVQAQGFGSTSTNAKHGHGHSHSKSSFGIALANSISKNSNSQSLSFRSNSNSSILSFGNGSSHGSQNSNSPKRVRRNLFTFSGSEVKVPEKRHFKSTSAAAAQPPMSPVLRSPRIGGLGNSQMFSPASSVASSTFLFSPRLLLSPSPNPKEKDYRNLSSSALFGFPSPVTKVPKAKRRLQLDIEPNQRLAPFTVEQWQSSISTVENSGSPYTNGPMGGTDSPIIGQNQRHSSTSGMVSDDQLFKRPAPSPGPGYKLSGGSMFNRILCHGSPATPPTKRKLDLSSPDAFSATGSPSPNARHYHAPSSCEKREVVAESPESQATTNSRLGKSSGFGRQDSYLFYSNTAASSSRAWESSGRKIRAARIKESVDLSGTNSLNYSDLEILPESPVH